MRQLIIILALGMAFTTTHAQRSRKFNPIYGNDADLNRTLTFVTDNLLFDSLTYTRIGNLDGYVRCIFFVDTNGKVVDVTIAKGLTAWIDYEIRLAMTRLPPMAPFKNRAGQYTKVKRDVYFTFNSDDENSWQNPYNSTQSSLDRVESLTQESLDAQRKAHFAKIGKETKAWDQFTQDNTKLSLDGKGVFKPGILPQNPLKITPPTTRPPISVSIKSE